MAGRGWCVRWEQLLSWQCWQLDVPRRMLITSRCRSHWANIAGRLSSVEGGSVSHPSLCPPLACIWQCVPVDVGALGSWEMSRPSLWWDVPHSSVAPHLSICRLLPLEQGFSMTRHRHQDCLPAHGCKTVRSQQDKDRDRPAVHTTALLNVQYHCSPSAGCRGSGQNSIPSLTPRATYLQILSATLEIRNDFAAEG